MTTFCIVIHVDFSNNHSIQFSKDFENLADLALVISWPHFDHVSLDDFPVEEGHLQGFVWFSSGEVERPLCFVEGAGNAV